EGADRQLEYAKRRGAERIGNARRRGQLGSMPLSVIQGDRVALVARAARDRERRRRVEAAGEKHYRTHTSIPVSRGVRRGRLIAGGRVIDGHRSVIVPAPRPKAACGAVAAGARSADRRESTRRDRGPARRDSSARKRRGTAARRARAPNPSTTRNRRGS